MRAHQIMTHKVLTVTTDTAIVDAANVMLQNHISGLPVINEAGKLVGVVSQRRFYSSRGNRHPA
jgi:CBS domain-containing protein